MPTLSDIKRRIRSVKNTQQITSAMEMVSAAKLRRAQSRVQAARPYGARLQQILENLAGVARDLNHPLFQARPEKNVVLVLVTGSKGLCGGYNSTVIKQADQFIKSRPAGTVKLYCVGRRGNEYFARRRMPIVASISDVNDLVSAAAARRVAGEVVEMFLSGEIDGVYLLYTQFVSALTRNVVLEKFLNIEPPTGTKVSGDYIFEPSPEEIFQVLPERYVANRLLTAFLESSASEHGARMTAMGSASRNASDMIGSLTLLSNRARQAAITKEISEIVGGAEALK